MFKVLVVVNNYVVADAELGLLTHQSFADLQNQLSIQFYVEEPGGKKALFTLEQLCEKYPPPPPPKRAHSVRATRGEEVLNFETINGAASHLGLNRATIRRRCAAEKPTENGWFLEEL